LATAPQLKLQVSVADSQRYPSMQLQVVAESGPLVLTMAPQLITQLDPFQ